MPRIAPLIFVSSTMDDLADYRLAIQQSFPALDALYRGMEFFGARPYRAHDVIVQELLECDLYLGILAHRYGAIDPDSGMSYTELEYQTAKREGIPTLFFLIDSGQLVHQDSIETDPDKRQKLADFKAAVSREKVLKTFTTPEDLVGKVGHSLQKWLDEQESQWQQLRHVPLNERDNNNIRKLYSTNTDEVTHVIPRLSRADCRAAYEHFYGLLYRPELHKDVAEKIFENLKFSNDNERVSQMLLNVIADLPRRRAQAINAIGERATNLERSITDAATECVLTLATDADIEVREEVAHALGKIGTRYSGRLSQCRECLELLKNDPVEKVRDRASISIQGLPRRR
jgi:hypothetical protein